MTRKEAYLEIVEGWLRNNRGIHFTPGSVDDLCDRIAAVVSSRRNLTPGPDAAARAAAGSDDDRDSHLALRREIDWP